MTPKTDTWTPHHLCLKEADICNNLYKKWWSIWPHTPTCIGGRYGESSLKRYVDLLGSKALSVHEDDNSTETLFFFSHFKSPLFLEHWCCIAKNCKHPEKAANSYDSYHQRHKAYFDEEVWRYAEQRGMDNTHLDPDDDDEVEVYDGSRTPSMDEGLENIKKSYGEMGKKTAQLASTVPDLDVASGVAVTASSLSSRVTGTHDRASFNPRSQLLRC